jgi:hypothetical protein
VRTARNGERRKQKQARQETKRDEHDGFCEGDGRNAVGDAGTLALLALFFLLFLLFLFSFFLLAFFLFSFFVGLGATLFSVGVGAANRRAFSLANRVLLSCCVARFHGRRCCCHRRVLVGNRRLVSLAAAFFCAVVGAFFRFLVFFGVERDGNSGRGG